VLLDHIAPTGGYVVCGRDAAAKSRLHMVTIYPRRGTSGTLSLYPCPIVDLSLLQTPMSAQRRLVGDGGGEAAR